MQLSIKEAQPRAEGRINAQTKEVVEREREIEERQADLNSREERLTERERALEERTRELDDANDDSAIDIASSSAQLSP